MKRINKVTICEVAIIFWWIAFLVWLIVSINICFSDYFEKEVEAEQVTVQVIEQVRNYKKLLYLDIPMSKGLQEYVSIKSQENGLPTNLTLAVISVESTFDPSAIGNGESYGLMQIHECNLEYLESIYGDLDLLNPEDNILGGTLLLGDLYKKYGDIHKVLMAYNIGEYGAKQYWKKGIVESEYSRKVVKKYNEYEVDSGTE